MDRPIFGTVALVLVIALIIAVVVITLIGLSHKNSIQAYGVALKIQEGVQSGTTDTMKTGGNNMYIVNSSSPITLTLEDSGGHLEGRMLWIKNNTTNNTTLQGEPGGVSLLTGQLNLTVEPGVTAILIAKDKSGTYLRLQ